MFNQNLVSTQRHHVPKPDPSIHDLQVFHQPHCCQAMGAFKLHRHAMKTLHDSKLCDTRWPAIEDKFRLRRRFDALAPPFDSRVISNHP